MPRDSAAADRPASYLVGTAAAFPLFFRDRTKPINQLPFSPSAKFPKSGSSCESRARVGARLFHLGAARLWRRGGAVSSRAQRYRAVSEPFVIAQRTDDPGRAFRMGR